jgi:hypothetical protein
VPDRRHPAIQSVQSASNVPTCSDPLLHHRSRSPARHRARNTAPPPPSALELAPDRTRPETDRTLPELTRVPARPSSHRHYRLLPCTQCTTPSWRNRPRRRIVSDEVHLDRAHAFCLYIEGSPLEATLALICFLSSSHPSIVPCRRLAEERSPPESSSYSSRSPSAEVEVAVAPAVPCSFSLDP